MSGVRYAMVGGGNVDASEVERADADVVDVSFAWSGEGANDRNVLAVKHLDASQGLAVGEEEGCDFVVPASVLGTARAEILRREGGKCIVVVPNGATALLDGWPKSEPAFELGAAQVAEVIVGGFSLRMRVVPAPKKVLGAGIGAAFQNGGMRSVLGSALMHTLAIAAVALFMPSLSSTDQDEIDRDRIVDMQKLLNASADKEAMREIEQGESAGQADSRPGDPAKGPEGQAGKENASTQGRMALKGDKEKEKTFSREQERQAAQDFGFISALTTFARSEGPAVPWGSVANGPDDKSKMGSLFGQTIDDGAGFGGLGLTGPGSGGGGNNPWIGLKGIGGLEGPGGPGRCTGPTCPGGDHVGGGRGGNDGYRPKPFTARPDGVFHANGRLDPAVIQRIIQQNFGRYRFCYEAGLRNNPSLAGHVGVKFVIDRTGAVSMAMDSGSTLPDSSVNQCVARAFTALSFPAPDGGQVTVQYGFMFSPS